MTIQDLGALGEFLGSIVVLVTLGYLAFQTRQNTMAIRAQLDVAVMAARQNGFLSAATSSEIVEAITEDSALDITTNQLRLGMWWAQALINFQWMRHQAQRGLLSTVYEAEAAEHVRSFFSGSRSFDGWWEESKATFLPDFVAWVEEQRAKAASQG
jgi:hypothetical protein